MAKGNFYDQGVPSGKTSAVSLPLLFFFLLRTQFVLITTSTDDFLAAPADFKWRAAEYFIVIHHNSYSLASHKQ